MELKEDATEYFKFKPEEYKRDVSPLKHYMDISSFVLEKMNHTREPKASIKEYIKEKQRFSNPLVYFKQRDMDGKISKQAVGLKDYLDDVVRDKNIIVPSFTVYFPPSKKPSLHSEFMDVNTKERSVHKKLAFKYKMGKMWDKFNYHNTIQKTKKIFNNSLSGAYASAGTILNNPSSHYTLTSITRAISGIGNAVSESLIIGNRHYRNPDVMIAHLATIAQNADLTKIEYVVNKYHLATPDAPEVMNYLLRSSAKYWKDTEKELVIFNFLKSLSKYERAAVLYHIDLNAIREFNDTFMRRVIGKFLNYEDKHHDEATSNKIIDAASEMTRSISIYSLSDSLKGKVKGKGDYTKEDLSSLASLIEHTEQLLKYLGEIVNAFFITDVVPANISRIKDMVREVIVLSDTDSTCASYEDWPTWYFGKRTLDSKAISISSLILFINSEVMDHFIKLFAVNLNISYEKAQILEMKSEFMFKLFVATNVSKHYYATTDIQEGNIFDPESLHDILEKKGVNLIVPNAYGPIRKLIDDVMVGIMHDVGTLGTIELTKYLKIVLGAEQLIISKIKDASPDIFKTEKIKDGSVYKNEPAKSPFLHYLFWNDIFGSKYGKAPDPTYMAIKVPLKINTKKDMSDFIENLTDPVLRDKIKEFLKKYNKDYIGVLRLPLIKVYEHGIPPIFKDWIDIKRVVKDNCNALYIVLETIGYFIKPDEILSDRELKLIEHKEIIDER